MKLYLSSYKLGNNPQALADLIGVNKKIAIIPNALDVYTDMYRRTEGIKSEKEGLLQIGLDPEELDLRNYFGKYNELATKLAEFSSVWVLGGNTFTLRRAFKQSGMDGWLKQKRKDENFVYAGYSAGVCVLSPSLKGLETVDSPSLVPDGYKPEIIWEGVGLIDFAFAPHYKSDHPESEMVDHEVEYYQKYGIEHKTLHDGEAIIMDSGAEK
jgi:dipeptidase E